MKIDKSTGHILITANEIRNAFKSRLRFNLFILKIKFLCLWRNIRYENL